MTISSMTHLQHSSLRLVTFNHRNTEVGLRDMVSLTEHHAPQAQAHLRERLGVEAAVLATCHRTEFYLFGEQLEHEAQIWPAVAPTVAALKGVAVNHMPRPDEFASDAAARHLFRVVSSLESIALGENQILSQVSAAHELLLEGPGKAKVLDKLFKSAIELGREVRSETSLCEGAVSISSVSVHLASRIFDLRRAHVVLLGAGETCAEAAKYFQRKGCREFTVVNRSAERGRQLAEAFGGRYMPLDALLEADAEADIVLAATGSPDHLLTREGLESARRRKRGQLLLLDISNPRNIAPECNEVRDVYLYNIGDLEGIAEQNKRDREREVPKVERIIDRKLADWNAWSRTLRVRPTLVAIRKHHEILQQQVLAKERKRLSDDEYAIAERVTGNLVKKLNINPSQHLRQRAEAGELTDEEIAFLWEILGLHAERHHHD